MPVRHGVWILASLSACSLIDFSDFQGGPGGVGGTSMGGSGGAIASGGSGGEGGAGGASCDGIDLDTDPDHCGECGHSCLGDPCSAGECEAAVVVDGETDLVDVAADATHVYWVSSSADDVLTRIDHEGEEVRTVLIPKVGTNYTVNVGQAVVLGADDAFLLENTPGGFAPAVYNVGKLGGIVQPFGDSNDANVSFAISGSHAFWINYQQDEVQRAPFGGGKDVSYAPTAGLDSTPIVYQDGRVFFATGNPADGIAHMDAALSPGSLVYVGAGRFTEITGLAADSTDLYVATNSSVLRLGIASNEHVELATGQAEIRDLTADATHLFWATATGQIKSLAKDGSDDGARLLAVSSENIEAVAVTADRVFWVTSTAIMRVTR